MSEEGMARTEQELQGELAKARAVYGGRFAGHPRASRSLEQLDEILGKVRVVAADAADLGLETVRAEADRLDAAWTEERQNIVTAQQGGVDAVLAADLGQWMRDCFERYRRLFAGHQRDTRDLGALREIIEEVERRIGQAETLLLRFADPTLADIRERAVSNLAIYRKELGEIAQAQKAGNPDQRASRLAGLANQQFARYRLHFAGQQRVSRRRRVLEHILQTLTEIHTDMFEVRALGATLPNHGRNIEIVESNLAAYERELQQLRVARSRATRADRIRGLAEAANGVFDRYRAEVAGRPRATRDPAVVAELWELLWPVALEMDDLAREDDADPVGSNLRKVHDNLRLYELEWERIGQARASAGSSNGASRAQPRS